MVYNIFSPKNKKPGFTAYEFHGSCRTKNKLCRPIVPASVMLKATSNRGKNNQNWKKWENILNFHNIQKKHFFLSSKVCHVPPLIKMRMPLIYCYTLALSHHMIAKFDCNCVACTQGLHTFNQVHQRGGGSELGIWLNPKSMEKAKYILNSSIFKTSPRPLDFEGPYTRGVTNHTLLFC